MMIDKYNNRRNSLKQGMLLGGVLLARSNVELVAVEEKPSGQPKTQPANETLKTIGSLRTIHGNFLNKEIPDAEVQQILQASIRAANASNMQSYSIIVVKDRALMKQVCTYQGGCMFLYCVDSNRLKDSAKDTWDIPTSPTTWRHLSSPASMHPWPSRPPRFAPYGTAPWNPRIPTRRQICRSSGERESCGRRECAHLAG